MKKKDRIISFIFIGFLVVMMLGILGPLALRRVGVLPAGEGAVLADEPDRYEEPVNLSQEYPRHECAVEEEPANGFTAAYQKEQQLEASLRALTSTVEEYTNENVPGRQSLIEGYIQIQKALGKQVIDGDDVVVKMDNGLLTFLSDELTGEERKVCSDNLTEFGTFVESTGAKFLYVQTPNKINKYDNRLPSGLRDYANSNADHLVEDVRDAGLKTLDLRNLICGDMIFDEAFYATDHHWKPMTGLWASGKVLETLNEMETKDVFDLSKVDSENYTETVYPDLFLGALGKKTGMGFLPLDDFSILKPSYETDFTLIISGSGAVYEGDFVESMIDESQLEVGDYYTKNPYAAYFHDDQALTQVRNHIVEGTPKVLLLKDSFGLAMAPFMATAVGELDVIDLRHFRGSIREYVEQTKPDIVVVMYNPKAVTAPVGFRADLFDFQ